METKHITTGIEKLPMWRKVIYFAMLPVVIALIILGLILFFTAHGIAWVLCLGSRAQTEQESHEETLDAIERAKPFDPSAGRCSPDCNHSGCRSCGARWCLTKSHVTMGVDSGIGMFPLCEDCWSVMTPAMRLPYYRGLFNEWEARDKADGTYCPRRWEPIEKAVLAGE